MRLLTEDFPSTTIRNGLPNLSHVTLTVFNTLGQQVAHLFNGDMESGEVLAFFEFSLSHSKSRQLTSCTWALNGDVSMNAFRLALNFTVLNAMN